MRGSRLDGGSRGRAGARLTGAVAAAALLAAAIALSPTPASAALSAHAAAAGPRITSFVVSRRHLPSSGGAVRVRASTLGASHCRLSVHPALSRPPKPVGCPAGHAGWRLRLPRNRSASPQRYRLRLTAGAAGRRTVRQRFVTVRESGRPPVVAAMSLSRARLPFPGGTVRVAVAAVRARTCRLRVSPRPVASPPVKDCGRGHARWRVHLRGNPSTTSPATYTVTVIARGSHRRTATRAGSVAVGTHPPPCPGQTSTAPPTTTALFNDPATHLPADQTRIVDAEINLICDAQLGTPKHRTHVDLAVYVYELEPVTQALEWAHHYVHADVHVVLDGSNNVMAGPDGSTVANPAYDDLVAGLPPGSVLLCGPNAGRAPPPVGQRDDSAVFPAGTGCAGDNILHTKLLTVSAVDAAGDAAVLTSSQNLSDNAEQAAFNDGLQLVGDSATYAADAAYFAALRKDRQDPDLGGAFPSRSHRLGGATVAPAYLPRNVPAAFPADNGYHQPNDARTDRVAALLRTVDCTHPGRQAGVATAAGRRSMVRIAMLAFGKRTEVTDALVGLGHAGCDVRVVYARMSKATRTALLGAGITVAQLDSAQYPFGDGSGSGHVFVHDKYVLISGGLRAHGATTTDQTLVAMGSANFTQKALHRNDEATVTYRQAAAAPGGPTVFDAYDADWQHLAAVAATAPAG